MTPERFVRWMRREQYAAQTCEDAGRTARRVCMLARRGEPLAPYMRKHARRMERASEATGLPWPPEVAAALAELRERLEAERAAASTPRQRRARRQAAQRRQEPPYDDESWAALYRAVCAERTPAAAVLAVMMATGLRVGDVLRITRQELRRGAETGVLRLTQKGGDERVLRWEGAADAWGLLADAWEQAPDAPTVAHLVAPRGDGSPHAGHAAYHRVRCELLTHAEALQLPGRAHLHRLRRTVIVQALVATGDVELARDLAGHASLSSTTRYVAHTRPEVVAKIQQQLAARRGVDDE